MVRNVKLDAYRRMKLWINELPKDASDIVMDKVYEYNGNENIHWFTGTQSPKFQVVYKFCNSDEIVQSDIAMQNDVVKNGIVKEYYKTLLQTFEKLSLQNKFPSGKLEILGGRYGSIGSSEVAVKVVLMILLKLFELNDHFKNTDINSIILRGCKEGA